MALHDCLVAFGSNQGDSPDVFARVNAALSALSAKPVLSSALHRTRPIGGPPGQPDYTNAVVRFETNLRLEELFDALNSIEQGLGRRRQERWGPRRVDLDLLFYDHAVLSTGRFIVPHPRMSHRRFVLEPAAEVAAEWSHPVVGLSIGELLTAINSREPLVIVLSARSPALVKERFMLAAAALVECPARLGQHIEGLTITWENSLRALDAVLPRGKLLCFDGTWRGWVASPSELQRAYRGPIVEIESALPPESARYELAAAIDAMD